MRRLLLTEMKRPGEIHGITISAPPLRPLCVRQESGRTQREVVRRAAVRGAAWREFLSSLPTVSNARCVTPLLLPSMIYPCCSLERNDLSRYRPGIRSSPSVNHAAGSLPNPDVYPCPSAVDDPLQTLFDSGIKPRATRAQPQCIFLHSLHPLLRSTSTRHFRSNARKGAKASKGLSPGRIRLMSGGNRRSLEIDPVIILD